MAESQSTDLKWPPKINRLSTEEGLKIVSTLEQESRDWKVGPVVDEAQEAIQRLLAERDFLIIQLAFLLRAHGRMAEAVVLERGHG